MRRLAMMVAVAGLAGLAGAPPTFAHFHLTKVSEVLTSRDGSNTKQFVELQDPSESFPDDSGPYRLIVYDAVGANPQATTLSAATLRNLAALRPMVVSTAAYDAATSTTGDFALTGTLPTNGQACFTAGASNSRVYCMWWGLVTVANRLTASGGTTGGAAPGDGQSLQTQCDGTAAVGTPTPAAANAALTPFCADGAPTAHLTFAPTAPTVGHAVTFDGSTSTDPDPSDHVASWHWTFDGTPETTTGATTTHVFTTADAHVVTLSVVDTLGKSSSPATATVTVAATGGGGGNGGGGGGPHTFAGVTVRTTKARVSSSRIAAVRVTCPAAATGSCSGKLTLKDGSKKVASKTFTASAGKTATVKLKLSASEFKKLRRKGRLKLRLTIAVHDGSSTAASPKTVKLTLTAPKH